MQCVGENKNSSDAHVPRLAICEKTSRKWLSERCLNRSRSRSFGKVDRNASEAGSTAVRYLPYEGQLKVLASITFLRSGIMRAVVQISDAKDLPPAPPGVSSEIQICLFKDDDIFMCRSVPLKQSVGIDLPNGPSFRNVTEISVSGGARLLISVYWQTLNERLSTTFVKSCMSFTLRSSRPIDDWYYLLDPEVGQQKHLRAAQQHLVGSLQPPAVPFGTRAPSLPRASAGLAPASEVSVRQCAASHCRHLQLPTAQAACSPGWLLQPRRPPMSDVTNLAKNCPARPNCKSQRTENSQAFDSCDDRRHVPLTSANLAANFHVTKAEWRSGFGSGRSASSSGSTSVVQTELPQFEAKPLEVAQSTLPGNDTLGSLQCVAVMQDGPRLEACETRSAGMLQPKVGISCNGVVARDRRSTVDSAVTAFAPAVVEHPYDAATALVPLTTTTACARPDSENLRSGIMLCDSWTKEHNAFKPRNDICSSSGSSGGCCSLDEYSSDGLAGTSRTSPTTSQPPAKPVAMFTIGENASSWSNDDSRESSELQPSRAQANPSATVPVATTTATEASVVPAGSMVSLDRTVGAPEAVAHPAVLPGCGGRFKCDATTAATTIAAAAGSAVQFLGSRAMVCSHANGSMLLPLLPRQHSLQEDYLSRATTVESSASLVGGAECSACSVFTSTTSSISCSHGRRVKPRKQRCSSDSSSGTEDTDGTAAYAARRQFDVMLPLRLGAGSAKQPAASCDCSTRFGAVSSPDGSKRHRDNLLSLKSCSAISGGHHQITSVGERQQQQPQPTAGGGASFGRISSAVELAGTAKKSWQRSAATFGRSKSLVCTSGPAGSAQPLPTVPSHALFLADASPRSKSHEAWRTQSGTGEKRNTFRKIARNVRNMMALLRLQKSHRTAAGSSTAVSSLLPGSAQVSLEMAEHWASSFSLLLSSKDGVELFRCFLHSEYSEENIEFWMACEEYRSTKAPSAAKLHAKAQAIFTRFVAPHAPKEVNLDSKTRMETESNLEHPDCNAFESAKQRIQCLMEKDSYPRFLRSPLYLELVEQLRAAAAAGGGRAF